jgi:hypothetical protein
VTQYRFVDRFETAAVQRFLGVTSMMFRRALVFAFLSGLCCVFAFGLARAGEIETNTNRVGGDYKDFEMEPSIAGFGSCQSSCEFDLQCKAWTFVKSGLQGPKAHCWLKNSEPTASNNNCCVSGLPVRAHGCEIAGKVRMDVLDRDCQEAQTTGCIKRLLTDAEYKGCLRAQPVVSSGCLIDGVNRKDIADRDCKEARDTGCIRRLLTTDQYRRCLVAQKQKGPATSPPAGGGTQVPAEWNEMLQAHNDLRKQHCAPPLRWDANLAAAAKTYAETGSLGVHGSTNENLANAVSFRTSNGVTTDVLPAKSDRAAFQETWGCEGEFYKYDKRQICGGFKQACNEPKAECGGNPVTGHFTQVVWKSATKVGCGRATRNINGHNGTAWVCRYDQGNINTPVALGANVLPAGCTP